MDMSKTSGQPLDMCACGCGDANAACNNSVDQAVQAHKGMHQKADMAHMQNMSPVLKGMTKPAAESY